VDTFQGSAWLGVMPFWMDRIKVRRRHRPLCPVCVAFPISVCAPMSAKRRRGPPVFYFLSLDASSLLAVATGRAFYSLPYHWAQMHLEQRTEREFSFFSAGGVAGQPVVFNAALPRVGSISTPGGKPTRNIGVLPL